MNVKDHQGCRSGALCDDKACLRAQLVEANEYIKKLKAIIVRNHKRAKAKLEAEMDRAGVQR